MLKCSFTFKYVNFLTEKYVNTDKQGDYTGPFGTGAIVHNVIIAPGVACSHDKISSEPHLYSHWLFMLFIYLFLISNLEIKCM